MTGLLDVDLRYSKVEVLRDFDDGIESWRVIAAVEIADHVGTLGSYSLVADYEYSPNATRELMLLDDDGEDVLLDRSNRATLLISDDGYGQYFDALLDLIHDTFMEPIHAAIKEAREQAIDAQEMRVGTLTLPGEDVE